MYYVSLGTMKTHALLIVVVLISVSWINVSHAAEERVYLYRADSVMMFKDQNRDTLGMLYFYVAINNTGHGDSSSVSLTIEITLYSWGNGTHLPPLANVSLLDVEVGYGFYVEGDTPMETVMRHPGPLVLDVGETYRWTFVDSVPSDKPMIFVHLVILDGVLLTLSDGYSVHTPETIRISQPSYEYSSYEIPIFDFHVTNDSPLYLGSKYHGFIFDFVSAPVETPLKLAHDELEGSYQELMRVEEKLRSENMGLGESLGLVNENLTLIIEEASWLSSELEDVNEEMASLEDMNTALDDKLARTNIVTWGLIGGLVLSVLGALTVLFSNPFVGAKAYLFDPDAGRLSLVGDRVIVKDGVAYEMGEVADQMVMDGLISVELLPGHDFEAWIKENKYTRAQREAKMADLISRRFWRPN